MRKRESLMRFIVRVLERAGVRLTLFAIRQKQRLDDSARPKEKATGKPPAVARPDIPAFRPASAPVSEPATLADDDPRILKFTIPPKPGAGRSA